MSGTLSGVDYSVLFPLPTSSTDPTSAILKALESSGSGNTATTTGNPLTDLTLAQKNEKAAVVREARDPLVAHDIAAFQKAVAGAKDIKSALADPAVQKVLLTASGLSSYIGETALVQKALLSNPTDPKSLVKQLSNGTWLNTVNTYNFASKGLAGLQNPLVIATLTQGYAEVKWRESLDKSTPGLASALAFLSQAKSIKTADDILGDPINRDVVTTAYGIPQQIAFQPLTTQEKAITDHLDISKLQNPKFVLGLTDQYLLAKQQAAQANAGTQGLTALAVQAGGIVV